MSTTTAEPAAVPPSTISRVRRGAYYLVGLAGIALFLAILGEVMTLTVLGWTGGVGAELGIHRLHVMGIGALVAAAFLLLLAALYRPEAHPAALWAFAGTIVVISLGAITQGPPVPFLLVAALLLLTYPGGRALLRRTEPYRPLLLLLVGLAALPGILYIADQSVLQTAMADEHAVDGHYGFMVALVGTVLVTGVIVASGLAGSRALAWIVGGLMAFFGVMSVAFPAQMSGVGALWGGLAVLWGVAFVVAAEYTRRTRTRTASTADPAVDAETELGAV